MIWPVLVSLFAVAADKPAPTPNSIAPSGKWIVDYRPNMCLASRRFGNDPDSVTLGIEPAVVMGDGDGTLLMMSANKYGSSVKRGSATISALPAGVDKRVLFVSWPVSPGVRGWEIGGESGSLKTLEDATGLTITMGRDTFALQTGKIKPVLDALSKCSDGLMRSWGIDPSARANPNSNPGSWFTDNDYPSSARSRGAQGRVTVVMTIAEDGRASACRVVISTGNPDLDKATCDLATRRGRFEKSTGKNDRYSVLSIRWTMM